MISMKKAAIAAACTTVLMASTAMANETYICKHGDQERIISVVYDVEGQAVPCKVVYTKDSGVETPWNAENKAGYCEEQAAAFVEKQRGWGWTCEKQNTAEEATNTAQEKAQTTVEQAKDAVQEATTAE